MSTVRGPQGTAIAVLVAAVSFVSCATAAPTEASREADAVPSISNEGDFSCLRGERRFAAAIGDTLTLGVPQPTSGRGVSDRLSVRLIPRAPNLRAIANGAAVFAVARGNSWVVRQIRACTDSVEVLVGGDSAMSNPTPAGTTSRRRFAGPTGRSDHDGTIRTPWSLAHALSLTGALRGGDTLQLLPGRYDGVFRSRLAGVQGTPVVIMGPDTGRAIIDGGLVIDGADSRFIGLEIMSSDPQRETSMAGSSPTGLARTLDAIAVNASRVALLGLVIHDLGNALFAGLLAEDLLLEGNIVYNNGWVGPDRGHGHGFYLQNRSPSRKRVVANVLFHQFSSGIKVSGSSSAWLDNVHIEDNISFDNGAPVVNRFGYTENIFHQGGVGRSGNLVFRRNWMVHSEDIGGTFKLNMGTQTPGNGLQFTDNLVQGRSSIGVWNDVVVRGNTFAMPWSSALRGRPMVESHAPTPGSPFITEWNRNRYVVRSRTSWPLATFVGGQWRDLPFPDWVTGTGADRDGLLALPSEVNDFVRVIPLPSLPGRGFVAHHSFQASGSFTVDISSIVRPGQRFEIRHVFALNGPPVASGTFTGQLVTLSATSPAAPDPIGLPLDRSRVRRPPAVYLVVAR